MRSFTIFSAGSEDEEEKGGLLRVGIKSPRISTAFLSGVEPLSRGRVSDPYTVSFEESRGPPSWGHRVSPEMEYNEILELPKRLS